jgi:hypothetical protein
MSIGSTIGTVLGISSIVGSVASGTIGAIGAESAANTQTTAEEKAIAEQQREFNLTQTNEQPFISAGQSSIADLMSGIQSGKFGATPPAPTYTGGTFQAPTLEQAEAQPGYQFSLQQGLEGITEASAAAGGAISGGTIKAADEFAQNLGETNYQNVFNQNLQTYNAGLSQYQAQLAGYGAQLTGQQQAENELLAPAQIGAGSTANLATSGGQTATSIAQLMSNIGTAQAGGTVGATNALTSGITSAGNTYTQSQLLKLLFPSGSTAGDTVVNDQVGGAPATAPPN